MTRITSWNINGIRAIQKKDWFSNLETISPDILGVQEIKADAEVMLKESKLLESNGWSIESTSASKKGYSGVGLLERMDGSNASDLMSVSSSKLTWDLLKTIYGTGHEGFDTEGRLITQIFDTKSDAGKIAVINGYYPQGGRGVERIEYKIKFYHKVTELIKEYHLQDIGVILCGDFNTTFADIDLARPKENRKTTGCLPEERDALNALIECGLTDTFRYLYPDRIDSYTYWDQITRARDRNVGWRIDMFLISSKLLPFIKDCTHHTEIMGSDHCPISLDITV
jgi:exodeoxyribonuclease III